MTQNAVQPVPETAPPTTVPQDAAQVPDWWNPATLQDAKEMAVTVIKSGLAPKDFRTPEAVVVAWSLGAPLGLSLLSSLQHIAVINGRPSIWGDAALAIVRAHPRCQHVHETLEGDGDDMVAVCSIQRRGDPEPVTRTFSVRQAKKASLWGKNVWASYPERMLQMRARSWALRDAFPDALCGMPIAEEVRDITEAVEVRDIPPEGSRTDELKSKLGRGNGKKKAAPVDAEDQPKRGKETKPAAEDAPSDEPAAEVRSETAPDDPSKVWVRPNGKRFVCRKGTWGPE